MNEEPKDDWGNYKIRQSVYFPKKGTSLPHRNFITSSLGGGREEVCSIIVRRTLRSYGFDIRDPKSDFKVVTAVIWVAVWYHIHVQSWVRPLQACTYVHVHICTGGSSELRMRAHVEFEVRAINGTGFTRLHALCTGASFLREDGHTISTRVASLRRIFPWLCGMLALVWNLSVICPLPMTITSC